MARVPEEIQRERDKWRFARRPEGIVTPGPGQESVWDFPRPPRLEHDPRRVRVEHAGRVIVDTNRALRICETASPPTFYLPASDADLSVIVRGSGRPSLCEWKGMAAYWSLALGNAQVDNVAWSYPDPFEEFAEVRDHLAFFAQKVDCFVGDERVTPQPGGFYGGWITSELVGPFKGEPGSGGW